MKAIGSGLLISIGRNKTGAGHFLSEDIAGLLSAHFYSGGCRSDTEALLFIAEAGARLAEEF
ncbi:MAG: hypothetical protein ACJ74J_06925 [Blastocatellia bacterium]